MTNEERLFSLVRERPNRNLPWYEPARCPLCGAEGQVRQIDHIETLVGSLGDSDPNHHWRTCHCGACDGKFTVEHKGGTKKVPANVWYTRRLDGESHLLEGIPSCFESYVYHCAHCDGHVRRRYTQLDGKTAALGLGWSQAGGYDYRTFYACDKCGQEIELPAHADRWSPHMNNDPAPPSPPQPAPQWRAFETMGGVIGHADALKDVDFS